MMPTGRDGEKGAGYGNEVREGASGRDAGRSGGGTLIAEYDGGISPRVGDLVACSTAETCPSAPQIARIRRIDRGAGVVEVQPMNRALERASVRFDAEPEDGLTVDGVVVAAYAPVYVRGEDGGAWWSVGGGRG